MKTTNCLIILLSALCLTGCKFDGSLRYEIWRLDASQATKVSFDMPWSTLDETVPLIEWVKVVPNEAVYIKLKTIHPENILTVTMIFHTSLIHGKDMIQKHVSTFRGFLLV